MLTIFVYGLPHFYAASDVLAKRKTRERIQQSIAGIEGVSIKQHEVKVYFPADASQSVELPITVRGEYEAHVAVTTLGKFATAIGSVLKEDFPKREIDVRILPFDLKTGSYTSKPT